MVDAGDLVAGCDGARIVSRELEGVGTSVRGLRMLGAKSSSTATGTA